jgi:hypothetical protein
MANLTSLQHRIDSTVSRLDRVASELAQRKLEQLQAEDAAQRQAEREQAKAYAEKRREYQARYSDAFQSFGVETPAPSDDETPFAYRRRLFNGLQRKLPGDHDLVGIRSDDISGIAMTNFEGQVIAEAKAEGLKPSFSNLPASGELVSRTRTDDMNGKQIEWFGRRSYIADMGLPGRRVVCLRDPRSGQVLLGRPPAIAPTFSR